MGDFLDGVLQLLRQEVTDARRELRLSVGGAVVAVTIAAMIGALIGASLSRRRG